MVRPADVIADRTALNGARIDVAARIGWLLRVSRLVEGVALRDMSVRLRHEGLPMSAPALSRLETSGTRDGNIIDAYERALGLEGGRLRAPIDVLCRTFRYAPEDRAPQLPGTPTLSRYDDILAPVLAGSPSGSEWFAFAREHTEREVGLPSAQMEPLIAQLASEMGRSVGTAYITRYEALARLRCGAYGAVVENVAHEALAEPGVQVLLDLMSALSERPTPQVLDWSGTLLLHSSLLHVHGAAVAIENMRSVGTGLTGEDWLRLTSTFLQALELAESEPGRMAVLNRLYRSLPPEARQVVRERSSCPLGKVRAPVSWTQSRRNLHFEYADHLAGRICSSADIPEQPMLTRLLFEVLYDFRITRAVTSSFLLAGSPLVEHLQPLLLEVGKVPPDETTRAGVESALATLQTSWLVPDVSAWLDSRRPETLRSALVIAGQAGLRLPEDLLLRHIEDPEVRGRALYCAGMSRHPLLQRLVVDRRQPAEVRAAARWWWTQGGRVSR